MTPFPGLNAGVEEPVTRAVGSQISILLPGSSIRGVPLVHLLDEFGHAERLVEGLETIGPNANTAKNLLHHAEIFGQWSIDARLTEAEQEVAQQAELYLKNYVKGLK